MNNNTKFKKKNKKKRIKCHAIEKRRPMNIVGEILEVFIFYCGKIDEFNYRLGVFPLLREHTSDPHDAIISGVNLDNTT